LRRLRTTGEDRRDCHVQNPPCPSARW
jgi:hypothetical protein